MKTYYKAPVMIAEFKNIQITDNNDIKYNRKDTVVEKNVEFYFNFSDTLVRKDTKFPVTLEEEVYDLFVSEVLLNEENLPTSLSYQYVDPLKLSKITPKEENMDRPKQKRKIFSFKCR